MKPKREKGGDIAPQEEDPNHFSKKESPFQDRKLKWGSTGSENSDAVPQRYLPTME